MFTIDFDFDFFHPYINVKQVVAAAPKSTLDADDESSDSSSDSSSSSDDSDDETAELMRELARIKQEREQEAARLEQERLERDARENEDAVLRSNPLMNASGAPSESAAIKRKWFDETVFKNQAKPDEKKSKRFINDTIRNDFHRMFLDKYIK